MAKNWYVDSSPALFIGAMSYYAKRLPRATSLRMRRRAGDAIRSSVATLILVALGENELDVHRLNHWFRACGGLCEHPPRKAVGLPAAGLTLSPETDRYELPTNAAALRLGRDGDGVKLGLAEIETSIACTVKSSSLAPASPTGSAVSPYPWWHAEVDMPPVIGVSSVDHRRADDRH